MARVNWTRDELLAVLKLYCRTPFGRLHSRNPDIVALAGRLGRTPNAVALKLVNFVSLDPTIDRKGMSSVSELDRSVWSDFFENMDRYLSEDQDDGESGFRDQNQAGYFLSSRVGLDVIGLSKIRINQGFFRDMILASYNGRCAITGIDEPRLLVASHIVAWAEESSLRTDPTNGICLNALHDRAFDCRLISFADDFSVLFSDKLPNTTRRAMENMGGKALTLPDRFLPNREFLARHRQQFHELSSAA